MLSKYREHVHQGVHREDLGVVEVLTIYPEDGGQESEDLVLVARHTGDEDLRDLPRRYVPADVPEDGDATTEDAGDLEHVPKAESPDRVGVPGDLDHGYLGQYGVLLDGRSLATGAHCSGSAGGVAGVVLLGRAGAGVVVVAAAGTSGASGSTATS